LTVVWHYRFYYFAVKAWGWWAARSGDGSIL